MPPAPPTIEAPAAISTSATPTPSPPPAVVVQEITPAAIEVVVPAIQADFAVALLSTVATPLLSVGVVTTDAPTVLPLFSSITMVLPTAVLVAMASPSLSSCPYIPLDHLYTSSDADSLWGATYKPGQKTSVGFVLAFNKNLIWSTGVWNAIDSTKVFL